MPVQKNMLKKSLHAIDQKFFMQPCWTRIKAFCVNQLAIKRSGTVLLIFSDIQKRNIRNSSHHAILNVLSFFSPRGLDALRKKGKGSIADLPIDSVSLSLQDLIGYFQPPGEYLEHEVKQNRLRALKNRQNLFQEEVRSACVSAVYPTKCQI